MKNPFLEANKKLWDAKTSHHVNSDFYKQKEFLEGECSLKEIELEELGDVNGKSLLHLQCHFGQDTISWARRGAESTGIDFSPKAIKKAREMNEQLNLDVKFIESDVMKLDKNLEGKFDIIFTSYGVIGWLPDLKPWAKIINYFLKPGGTFLIVEFHPTMWLFDWDTMDLAYHYFNVGKPDHEIEKGTYADTEAE
ncbi:MAG: class I SAM-dependent methyltransferase, partial [Saprospiraceae bacterium]